MTEDGGDDHGVHAAAPKFSGNRVPDVVQGGSTDASLLGEPAA